MNSNAAANILAIIISIMIGLMLFDYLSHLGI